jgi:prevent-host-death family protein
LRRRTKFNQLLDWVERGEEITITRHGKEVARPVPAKPGFNRAEAHAVLRRIRERAEQSKLGASDWWEWRAFRDERRP